jgi:transposase
LQQKKGTQEIPSLDPRRRDPLKLKMNSPERSQPSLLRKISLYWEKERHRKRRRRRRKFKSLTLTFELHRMTNPVVMTIEEEGVEDALDVEIEDEVIVEDVERDAETDVLEDAVVDAAVESMSRMQMPFLLCK